MNAFSAENLKWVPRGEIDRHAGANPKILGVAAKAASIAANFDADAFGVITVSKQKSGRYVCLDGQTRLLAIGLIGCEKTLKVPCVVHEGLKRSEEAGLFQRLNNHVVVPFTAKFMSRVVEGEPVALAINSIVKTAGFHVGHKAKDDVISATKSLQDVYLGRGFKFNAPQPQALEATLLSLSAAFGRTRESVTGKMIEAVGAFWLKYPEANLQRFVAKLTGHTGGITSIIARGKGEQANHGGGHPVGIARHLVRVYNTGLKSGKSRLNGWDDE
jgi:hypothetical protein